MSALVPKGAGAVMASRKEPPHSLDFFPTPPWATRAIFPFLREIDPRINEAIIQDPCAGEGHMAEILRELGGQVFASDVFDYGVGYDVVDYLDPGAGLVAPGWVIFNPPFNAAESFFERAINEATRGVAMFIRLQFLEAQGRWETVFNRYPPRLIALFSERVALHRGVWRPDGSTATAYCWIVWSVEGVRQTEFRWLPPVQKKRLHRAKDVTRFAAAPDMPLFPTVARPTLAPETPIEERS